MKGDDVIWGLGFVVVAAQINILQKEIDAMLVQLKQIQSGGSDHPSALNKNMAVLTTAADFDAATVTGVAATPFGYVGVTVNGVQYRVGNGVKTLDCYFSNDAGGTARAFGAIAIGDLLYWVGSVAQFQLLAGTDVLSYYYDA